MEERLLYPDDIEKPLTNLLNDYLRKVCANNLTSDIKQSFRMQKEPLGTLVYFEKKEMLYSSRASDGLTNLWRSVQSLGAAAAASEQVNRVYLLQEMNLKDFDSQIYILYQGGFVKEDVLVFSTMSIGTIMNFSIPRGFLVTTDGDRIFRRRLRNCGDQDNTNLSNPLASVLEAELANQSSEFASMYRALPIFGCYETGKYYAAGSPMVLLTPRMGKTIVSVMVVPYTEKLDSKAASYRMNDLSREGDIKVEIGLPSEQPLNVALHILRKFRNLPNYLRSSKSPTSSILGLGIDAILTLDIARDRYLPERNPFTLWEILTHSAYVREVAKNVRTDFRDMEFPLFDSIPGHVIVKK